MVIHIWFRIKSSYSIRKKINKNNSTIDDIKPVMVAQGYIEWKQEKQKGQHGPHETFQSNKKKKGVGKRATFT